MSNHCHVDPISKPVSESDLAEARTVDLAILGMGCPNCANRVRNSLLRLDGVLEAEVDHVLGTASVRYRDVRTTVLDLIEAVRQSGGDGRHEYRAFAIRPPGDELTWYRVSPSGAPRTAE